MTIQEQLKDAQHKAYVLADLAKCLDLIIEEGDAFTGPKSSVAGVVFEKAKALSDLLEGMGQHSG